MGRVRALESCNTQLAPYPGQDFWDVCMANICSEWGWQETGAEPCWTLRDPMGEGREKAAQRSKQEGQGRDQGRKLGLLPSKECSAGRGESQPQTMSRYLSFAVFHS